jgi:hypothetical protein
MRANVEGSRAQARHEPAVIIRMGSPTFITKSEVDGVHVDQSASVLWHLKLATS